jgi:hypothetical protein
MTTNVIVQPHSHDVMVEVWDREYDHETNKVSETFKRTSEQLVRIGESETFYSTTTREIRIVDLEQDDPRRSQHLRKSS